VVEPLPPVPLPPVPLPPVVEQLPPAVEREWRARAWAIQPDSAREEIQRALASPDWPLRHMALDALARSPAGVRLARALDADGMRDAHPNVRAAAVELAVWTGMPLDLSAQGRERWAAEPSESVRRALARHLALHSPGAGLSEAHLDLSASLAARVGPAAEVARAALFSHGPGAVRVQLPLLLVDGVLDRDALLAALPFMKRAPVDPALVEALRRHLPAQPLVRESLATLVECLALHGALASSASRFGSARGSVDGSVPRTSCDFDTLVAGWLAFQTGEDDDVDYRAEALRRELLVEAAREGHPFLGLLLISAAGELDELARSSDSEIDDLRSALTFPRHAAQAERHLGYEAGAIFLAECAADALDPLQALEAAREFSDELAGEIWNRVAYRVERLDPEQTAEWLAPTRSEELRYGVASVVADVFHTGDPEAERLLLRVLDDPDSGMRRAAFTWLSDDRGLERRLPAMHAAWLRYDGAERALHLRSLSRRVPPEPFLPDLLALCQDPAGRTEGVLELLGLFRERVEVRDSLRAWRDGSLASMEAAGDLATYRRHEWRAKALVLAIGPDAVPELAGVLRRSLASRPILAGSEQHERELPKVCAGLLGASAEGRAELTGFLGAQVARRTRIEAAIQLAGDGRSAQIQPEVLRVLTDGYPHTDSELGVRVLEAAGRSPLPAAESFLEAAAADRRADLDRRFGALVALARRGAAAALVRAGLRDRNPEVVREAVRLLGLVGGDVARPALRQAWSSRRARLGTDEERSSDRLLAVESLVAAIEADALRVGELGLWFEEPLGHAAANLGARFAGEHLPSIEFQWRSELELVGLLARKQRLDVALTGAGAYWRADGRLLARLAEEAGPADAAQALALAASVALAGEPPAEGREEQRTRVAILLMELAVRSEDWEAAGAWADRLYLEARLARGLLDGLEPAFPAFDRRAGLDPWADLGAARHQARAWAALDRGDRAAAGDLARIARRHLGASLSAREAQAVLEAALRE